MRFHLLCLLAVGAVLAGCGGSSTKGEAEVQLTYGSIATQATTAAKAPVIMTNGSATMTAIFGAQFTKATMSLPPLSSLSPNEAILQTTIAMDSKSHPYLYDYGLNDVSPIGPVQPYTDDCSPSFSGNGLKLAVVQPHATLRKLVLYTMNVDGTGKKMVVNLDTDMPAAPAFSPNGQTIAYHTISNPRIYTVPAAGGTPTVVSPTGQAAYYPVWSLDGTKIYYYAYDTGDNKYHLQSMNANGAGAGAVTYATATTNPHPISCIAGTTNFIETVYNSASSAYEVGIVNPGNYRIAAVSSATAALTHASMAPTGDRFVYQKANSGSSDICVHNFELNSDETLFGGSLFNSPDWGPYVQNRILIGTGGPMGASAGGMVFGQLGRLVTSFVSFDAVTRSTLAVTPQSGSNPYTYSVVCVVTADKLNSLKFTNNVKGTATAVVSASAPVNGAVLAFESSTGHVQTIAPYVGSVAAAGQTYKAKFVGVWNQNGENKAPNGASELAIEPKSGIAATIR